MLHCGKGNLLDDSNCDRSRATKGMVFLRQADSLLWQATEGKDLSCSRHGLSGPAMHLRDRRRGAQCVACSGAEQPGLFGGKSDIPFKESRLDRLVFAVSLYLPALIIVWLHC